MADGPGANCSRRRGGGNVRPAAGCRGTNPLPDCAPNVEAGHAPGALATVLPAGVMIGPWSRLVGGRGWQVILASAAVALTALVQFIRLSRARPARRRQAALDA